MNYEKLDIGDFEQLVELERLYKHSVGEADLDGSQIARLKDAVQKNQIEFFAGKENNGKIIAMCSVSVVFSTFSCAFSGIFEDFFILEEYRQKGIARELTGFVFDCMRQRNINAVWVGCADADLKMYESLGFSMRLGNLLTWHA